MKQISTEQINGLLQVIYQTNISAQNFDAVKKMLADLPEIKEVKDDKNKETTEAKETK